MSEKDKTIEPGDLVDSQNTPYDLLRLKKHSNVLFLSAEIKIPEEKREALQKAMADAYCEVMGHSLTFHPWMRVIP